MNLLLSENLPLRTTKVFGTFAEEAVLPHHYGDLSKAPVPLVKLSPTNFLVADHPVVRVVSVQIDGVDISGFSASVATDPTGHAYALVVLAAPLPDGSDISASILGKFNPTTGGLMDTPADIVEDIFALAGKDDKVPQLRIETSKLKIAGSLTELVSIRASIDLVMRSIGAIWTSGMARLYPPEFNTHIGQVGLKELNLLNSGTPSMESVLADTTDSLQINFDYCGAKGEFLQSLTLKATPSQFKDSNVQVAVREVDARWIRQVSDAEVLGRRLLGRLATDKVAVSMETSEASILPGQWVTLNHPSFPDEGTQYMMVLGISIPPFKGQASISGEVIYGDAPLITITQVSKAAPTDTSSGVAVAYANGTATFTVLDPQGAPLMGALVALDRGQAKKTNAKGQVSFTTTPGKHTLGIQADGYIPFEMDVSV